MDHWEESYNSRFTFISLSLDKKSMYQNSGVCVDAYDITGQDKNMYYGQIQEIWELDFHGFKIPLFCCNWVDTIKGVVQDNTCSLVLTLTVKDISQSISC
jgi:hypothetical protein